MKEQRVSVSRHEFLDPVLVEGQQLETRPKKQMSAK